MTVRYVRVQPDTSALFAPATRAYGNIAVVGAVTPPAKPPDDIATPNVPILFTDPNEAERRCPGDLGNSIALAFAQTPGPSVVYGVRTAEAQGQPDWTSALTAVATLPVQLVVLANTTLITTTAAGGATPGVITQLATHVITMSNTGPDGMERMGVAMLPKGIADTSIVAGTLASDRMVYVAHKSDQDAAAAVAGVIAGYQPSISMLLKPVNINSDPFTPDQIDTINGPNETAFDSPPAGKGVVWLTHPALFPGGGIYLGEGYTGNPAGGIKFIDVRRTIDDVSFRLKAQLINSIGSVRITRSGLRALIAQMEAVLDPLVNNEVLDRYTIVIPLLTLLDKDPAALTPSELTQISNAHANRLVEVTVVIEYAGAIHRLAIKLSFT